MRTTWAGWLHFAFSMAWTLWDTFSLGICKQCFSWKPNHKFPKKVERFFPSTVWVKPNQETFPAACPQERFSSSHRPRALQQRADCWRCLGQAVSLTPSVHGVGVYCTAVVKPLQSCYRILHSRNVNYSTLYWEQDFKLTFLMVFNDLFKKCGPKQASYTSNLKVHGKIQGCSELLPCITYRLTILLLLPCLFCAI